MKTGERYKRFQKIWYMLTGLTIAGLAGTGFEIHGSYSLVGYRAATVTHDILFSFLIFLGVLYAFWGMVTGNGLKALTNNLRPGRNLNIAFVLLLWGVMLVSGGLYIGFVIFHDAFAANVSRAAVAYTHTIGAFMVLTTGVWHLYYKLVEHRAVLSVRDWARDEKLRPMSPAPEHQKS